MKLIETYRGMEIRRGPFSTIIPGRQDNYQWSHLDFDGAIDSKDDRAGSGSTVDECREWIDFWYDCEHDRNLPGSL